MNARTLATLCWTLWGILLAGVLYASLRLATERTTSPEAGRGLGVLLAGALLAATPAR